MQLEKHQQLSIISKLDMLMVSFSRGMLLSVSAAFAAEQMAPSDIQFTFFNGKQFAALSTSGTQFKSGQPV